MHLDAWLKDKQLREITIELAKIFRTCLFRLLPFLEKFTLQTNKHGRSYALQRKHTVNHVSMATHLCLSAHNRWNKAVPLLFYLQEKSEKHGRCCYHLVEASSLVSGAANKQKKTTAVSVSRSSIDWTVAKTCDAQKNNLTSAYVATLKETSWLIIYAHCNCRIFEICQEWMFLKNRWTLRFNSRQEKRTTSHVVEIS